MNTDLLRNILGGGSLLEHQPLSAHTTFKTGGDADCICLPESEAQLADILTALKKSGVPYFIMGRGSNVLASDAGFRGAVVKIAYGGIRADGNTIYADAGVPLKAVAAAAAKAGLRGLEFAAGIPGSLGGGIAINAGAYDGELGDHVTTVRILGGNGKLRTLSNAQMEFSYRHSIMRQNGGVVLGASFALTPDDSNKITARMEKFAARRREKQPLEYPSAGSIFKRPKGGYAGALIEQCGLKGYTLGGACVSPKHAGFIINAGGAASADIYRLIRHVQDAVLRNAGVLLEPEIQFLGEFSND
jgi:UDP-N-acetylmuramate dehydrogenase